MPATAIDTFVVISIIVITLIFITAFLLNISSISQAIAVRDTVEIVAKDVANLLVIATSSPNDILIKYKPREKMAFDVSIQDKIVNLKLKTQALPKREKFLSAKAKTVVNPVYDRVISVLFEEEYFLIGKIKEEVFVRQGR